MRKCSVIEETIVLNPCEKQYRREKPSTELPQRMYTRQKLTFLSSRLGIKTSLPIQLCWMGAFNCLSTAQKSTKLFSVPPNSHHILP